MPFFLVTQISLVEAQDEEEAAQTGVDRLRAGDQVTVTVRSDATTITQVVVAAVAEEPLAVLPSDPSPAAICLHDAKSAATEGRTVILKRMLTDALALLGRRT